MGIELRRLGYSGVNLVVFGGHIDRGALIEFWKSVDANDPLNAKPWILYLMADADMSDVDIATFAEMKRILAPIRDKAAEKKDYIAVMVSHSDRCDILIKFWRDFVSKDSRHPPYAVLFSDINSACDSLKLPSAAQEGIADVIRAQRVARDADEGGRFSADRP
jgi:hypothetical protein